MVSLLETKQGRFIPGGGKELNALFQRLASKDEPKLLLHAHGGLVDERAARSDAHWFDGSHAYGPLHAQGWETSYLIWRTGFLDAVGAGLTSLASDVLFSAIMGIVRRWAAGKALDVADLEKILLATTSSLAEIEVAYRDADFLPAPVIAANLSPEEQACVEGIAEPGPGDELYDELARDAMLQMLGSQAEHAMTRRESAFAALQAPDETILASIEKLDTEVQDEIAGAFSGKAALEAPNLFAPVFLRAARAGYRVVRRAMNGRDHGFQATIVEELSRELYADLVGSRIWGQMKRFASDHFAKEGAGTELIAKLDDLAAKTDGPVRLLFVGHSAGAILACELLVAASGLPSNVKIDFVFLAPAVRIDRAARVLAAAETRVDNLRIFMLSDEREKEDALDGKVPLNLYPRSLLYLISGVLENRRNGDAYPDAPLLGMQRHLEGLRDSRLSRAERSDRDSVLRFLKQPPSRFVFSPSTSGSGLNSEARTHGTIDNDSATLASIRHIASNGYGV